MRVASPGPFFILHSAFDPRWLSAACAPISALCFVLFRECRFRRLCPAAVEQRSHEGTARPSRSQDQIGLNAEAQRNAEKRREEELSANLCESLRLCVKSSQPASKAGYSSAKAESKAMLAISPKSAVSWLFPRVFAPSLFTSNCGDKALILRDLRRWQSGFGRLCLAILHSSFCLLHSLGTAPASARRGSQVVRLSYCG